MMFCPVDKALMRPKDGVLACPKCGHTPEDTKKESMIVQGKARDDLKKSVLIDEETAAKEKDVLPKTQAHCEKCGHEEAYYFFRQTRAADEATTRFMECTSCGNKWRDYN